jgi:hypothetical protein
MMAPMRKRSFTSTLSLLLEHATFLLLLVIGTANCSGDAENSPGDGDGDGDASPGTGGEAPDPGGVGGLVDVVDGTGGSPSTGGSDGVGGSDGTGGTTASGGGDGDGDFGGWDDVRCYEENTFVYCFAVRGTFAAQVIPTCTIDKDTRPQVSPETALRDCGTGSVDPGVWEDVRCFEVAADFSDCWTGMGGWWVPISNDCGSGLMGTPVDPNGFAQEQCGVDVPATGWDEIQCSQAAPDEDARCAGRLDNYWTTPAFPSCELDDMVAQSSGEVEPSMSLCE